MPLISDNYHHKKLNDLGINIKTLYIVGNNILERNTNNSKNDDIKNGIRCKKEYFKDKKLIHNEVEFDSRIEYTFISSEKENEEFTCPNCGMKSKIKDFVDGCPYCNTYYNIDYMDKELGSKKHYDRCLRNNTYRVITAIVDVIISIIISFIFIKITSRTFNNIDIIKVFAYGIILSLVLYYFFYIIDAYIILGPIKRYKDKLNKKQKDFWQRTNIDKKNFFNNFNYELRKYYHSQNDVIDFDIIDYDEFQDIKKDNSIYVKVKCEIRLIYYKSGRVKHKYLVGEYIMRKNENNVLELNSGTNLIRCHNCGSSINIEEGKCSYCGTEIKYFQEWILEK